MPFSEATVGGASSLQRLLAYSRYTYDLAGRLVQTQQLGSDMNNGKLRLGINTDYLGSSGLVDYIRTTVSKNNGFSAHAYTETKFSYESSPNDRVSAINFKNYTNAAFSSFSDNDTLRYGYDALGRLTVRYIRNSELDSITNTTYTYDTCNFTGNRTTARLKRINNKGATIDYTYDANGNITRITQAGNVAYEYEYDALGQLTRVDDYVNDETVTYQYDANGNLTWEIHHDLNDLETDNWRQYRQYDNTTWRDLLTYYFDSETDERVNITYDAIGNPGNWRNGMTLTWEGRSLKTVKKNSATLATYTYNADGVRVKKVSGGVTTTYYVEDGVCYGESRSDGKSLQYLRDENGQVVGVRYQNGNIWDTTYYFVFNGQGDVIQVVSAEDGQVMANYTYDAWGKLLSVTNAAGGAVSADAESIAAVNPFRYRGYYYDTETGLYYLQSRYYDADVGRFVNADNVVSGTGESVEGYNLFTYCFNNPVNMSDETGTWPQWIKNTVKWVAENIVKPVMKTVQKTLSKVDATYSSGINVSGTPSAFIFNLQVGVSVDTKGNVAMQAAAGSGVTGGSPGASVTTYRSVTNAPSIDKLEGPGYQVGGSVGAPVYGVPLVAAGDFNILPDSALNKAYFGATANVGVGTPGGEFHVEWGGTATLNATRFNVFDVAEEFYIRIMEW